ncbi:MAG: polynucleotide adenylyltransferase PcnB [Oceanospirillaceae bacterium]|nr:polynucleotide adenylyltransferase PcnB [Oceanospirillaceae bacterium]
MPMGLISKLVNMVKGDQPAPVAPSGPNIITRDHHDISRRDISDNALKVLYRLKDAGYQAFLVGGGVRDILLGKQPKDFDIATDAHPEQVHKLFRNSILIGRRFRLVHVRFGREVIEVATFRASHNEGQDSNQAKQADNGMLLRDNVYGTVDDDAMRRDFTINAMYYNINGFTIHDFAGGVEDIEQRNIRMIGEPQARYREDPVRMLRAIRFAAKLDFDIDPATAEPIHSLGHLLEPIPAARMFEEVLKLLLSGNGEQTYYLLRDYDLFKYLFPATDAAIEADQSEDYQVEEFVILALRNSDERIAQGKSVTPAYLFASLLWHPLQERLSKISKMPPIPAMHQAAQDVILQQVKRTSIPRRFSPPMKEIWDMQLRLPRRHGNRAAELVENKRFRAAYDFILLRESSGEDLEKLGEWWTEYQFASGEKREQMTTDLGKPAPKKRKPKKNPQA